MYSGYNEDAQAQYDLELNKLESQGLCTAHLTGPDDCWCPDCQWARWAEQMTDDMVAAGAL